MRELAIEIRKVLNGGKELDKVGEILHQGWLLKKELTSGISNTPIDGYYNQALEAGALGGKVLGAGGGGFILLYCPSSKKTSVRTALSHLKELPFQFTNVGSRVIFNYYRK